MSIHGYLASSISQTLTTECGVYIQQVCVSYIGQISGGYIRQVCDSYSQQVVGGYVRQVCGGSNKRKLKKKFVSNDF